MIFKVSRSTEPNKLAAAIIGATEDGPLTCQALNKHTRTS